MNKAHRALMASISIALLTLGACKKEEVAAAIDSFNPDEGWKAVPVQ